MKCIQSIKQTKNIELGITKRVDDVDAESSVKSGYWKYVPKSEWKKTIRVESKKIKLEPLPDVYSEVDKKVKNKKFKKP
jgi:hypothetical protein